MNFGEVFFKAAKITWKNKVLWIPAILLQAVMLIFTNMSSLPRKLGMVVTKENASAILIFISLYCLAFFLLMILLGTANLVINSRGVYQADKRTISISLRELTQSVRSYFWRVVGLSLILTLVGLALILPTLCLFVFLGTSITSIIISYPWVISLSSLLLGTISSGLSNLPLRVLILEDMSIFESWSRGWKIYAQFLGINLLMGLLLSLGGFGLSYVIGLPQNLIIDNFLAIFTNKGLEALNIFLYFSGGIVYWLVWSILIGIFQTYYHATWTLTFLRLSKLPVVPAPAPAENAPVSN